MTKSIQEDFLYKKTYEFAYATLSIASSAKSKEIAGLLESKAFFLLDSVLTSDYERTGIISSSIISLVGLMVDGGILNPINREVLMRESENVTLAIRAVPKKGILPDLNLGKVFSKSGLPNKKQIANTSPKTADLSEIDQKTVSEISDKSFSDKISDKSESRQLAIVEKLREMENCRLNELQSVFTEVSDRTLRYDLESLILKGTVERVGSRKNSIYRLTAKESGIIELPAPSAPINSF
ncbi:MAG: hypothetical protein HY432_02715 [Candidatus Liptonbacteria bacterium]|nr:hypothetical protein [Candidatus Liptonbacteria bacterium]